MLSVWVTRLTIYREVGALHGLGLRNANRKSTHSTTGVFIFSPYTGNIVHLGLFIGYIKFIVFQCCNFYALEGDLFYVD